MEEEEDVDEVKDYIESKGGTFILKYQEKSGKQSRWFVDYFCDNGHENVHKRADSLKKGWCARCTTNTIEDAHNLAKSLGWKFLSTEYINSSTSYRWECEFGHQFNSVYTNVHSGKGCKQCLTYSFEDIKKIIEDKGGKCLTDPSSYTNLNSRVELSCGDGHTWETSALCLRRGTWCTECNIYMSERTCRKIIEYIYGQPFNKQRPDWLLSDQGTRLELDCYNGDLKIAIEYNGGQHEKITYFHKTQAELDKRQKDDATKVTTCHALDVTLIVVPHTVKYEDLYAYIRQRCPNLPANTPLQIDYKVLGLTGYGSEKIKEINEYLLTKYGGGTVVSDNYVNNHTNLKCKCVNGHEVKTTFSILLSGTFCKECTLNKASSTFYEKNIKPFCDKNGFKMIGIYKNAKTTMEWKCNTCDTLLSKSQWDGFKNRAVKCHKCHS
jgi:hypothetical protein